MDWQLWKFRKSGYSYSTPTRQAERSPGVRGAIRGWSPRSAKANSDFLQSVDFAEARRRGLYAITHNLTVRGGPDVEPITPEQWRANRRRFWQRVMLIPGVVGYHWVMEYQANGSPHLHAVVFYLPREIPDALRSGEIPLHTGRYSKSGKAITRPVMFRDVGDDAPEMLGHFLGRFMALGWIDIWVRHSENTPELVGQHWAPVENAIGWMKYLSKHAARSVKNYQRTPEPGTLHESWVSSDARPGPVWGHAGDIPLAPELEAMFSPRDGVRLRRVVAAARRAAIREDLRRYRRRWDADEYTERDMARALRFARYGLLKHPVGGWKPPRRSPRRKRREAAPVHGLRRREPPVLIPSGALQAAAWLPDVEALARRVLGADVVDDAVERRRWMRRADVAPKLFAARSRIWSALMFRGGGVLAD